MGVQLLPAKKGTCPVCATEHPPEHIHNNQSIFYQMRFQGTYGRWPTWADAIAHCSAEIRAAAEQTLREMGHWSQPPEGVEPVAEWPEGVEQGPIHMKGMEPKVVSMDDSDEDEEYYESIGG